VDPIWQYFFQVDTFAAGQVRVFGQIDRYTAFHKINHALGRGNQVTAARFKGQVLYLLLKVQHPEGVVHIALYIFHIYLHHRTRVGKRIIPF
jgi:hypothetical protein